MLRLFTILAAALLGLAPVLAPAAQPLTPEEARAIAKEATIYGFSLVDNYRINYAYFVDKSNRDYKAPWNTLFNNPRVFTPEDKVTCPGS